MTEKDFCFRSEELRGEDLALYNARKAPFRLYGLYRPEEEGLFKRMPESVATATSKRMSLLYTNTAGARLRFSTDSQFLAIGAVYPPMEFPSARTAALSAAGAFCFDLYADGEHCRVLWHQGLTQNGSAVSFDLSEGRYEAWISFEEKKMRSFTLCFPSFVNISDLFVGLKQDAVLREGEPYVNEIPVCFYGSSITQGACASRSGNTYPNLLSERFNFDYVNLGFASACKAEDSVIDYLCSLPMSLLVFDYDHNAPSAEFLESTHLPALRRLRAAHPRIPFILLSKPNRHNGREEGIRRMKVIEKSARILQEESSAPVHFVNGQEVFESHDRNMMTVDGTHPTDLGFYCMAEALNGIFSLYF